MGGGGEGVARLVICHVNHKPEVRHVTAVELFIITKVLHEEGKVTEMSLLKKHAEELLV